MIFAWELHSLAAKVDYCIGDFERSDVMAKSILAHARSIEDRASAYYAEMDSISAQAMQALAIDKGISILQLLGERVKRRPNKLNVLVQLARTKRLLRGKSDEFILSLPFLENDAVFKIVMTVLDKIKKAAYFAGEMNVLVVVTLRQLQLTIEKGHSAQSPSALASYALLQSRMGNTNSAYRFGTLALELMAPETSRTLAVAYTFAIYWKSPMNIYATNKLRDAHISGIAHGDMEGAFIAAAANIVFSLHCGTNLFLLEKDISIMCEKMQVFKQEHALNVFKQNWWAVHQFLGTDLQNHPLSDVTNEADILRNFSAKTPALVTTCRLNLLLVTCHDGSYATAKTLVDKMEKDEHHLRGHFLFLTYKFYSGLTLYRCAATESSSVMKIGCRRRADKVRRYMMKLDAKGCPTATLFLALLNAERMLVLSKDTDNVLRAYKHAITVSADNRFVNYEGLACERAAKASMERHVDARSFLDRAMECYSEWGAQRNLQCLQLLRNSFS